MLLHENGYETDGVLQRTPSTPTPTYFMVAPRPAWNITGMSGLSTQDETRPVHHLGIFQTVGDRKVSAL